MTRVGMSALNNVDSEK